MTNRERFLKWYKQEVGTHEDAQRCRPFAWAAWQAACPKGWQCVPVEPTDKMRRRALSVNDFESGGTSVDEFNSDIYLAMLSAAPKPEDV